MADRIAQTGAHHAPCAGADRRQGQVGLTQEAQHRLHREYQSTKVASCKLPDGALSFVMLGWDAKRAGFATVSFGRGLNLLGFLRQPNMNWTT